VELELVEVLSRLEFSLRVSPLVVVEVEAVVVAEDERLTIACTVVRADIVEGESKSSNRLPSLAVKCIERVVLSVER